MTEIVGADYVWRLKDGLTATELDLLFEFGSLVGKKSIPGTTEYYLLTWCLQYIRPWKEEEE